MTPFTLGQALGTTPPVHPIIFGGGYGCGVGGYKYKGVYIKKYNKHPYTYRYSYERRRTVQGTPRED
jgi:hypothetical protein